MSYGRLSSRIDPVQRQDCLGNIDDLAIVAAELPVVNMSRDPSDNIILATAVAGAADVIVSGDKPDMLALGEVRGIPIITAREAVDRLGLSDE